MGNRKNQSTTVSGKPGRFRGAGSPPGPKQLSTQSSRFAFQPRSSNRPFSATASQASDSRRWSAASLGAPNQRRNVQSTVSDVSAFKNCIHHHKPCLASQFRHLKFKATGLKRVLEDLLVAIEDLQLDPSCMDWDPSPGTVYWVAQTQPAPTFTGKGDAPSDTAQNDGPISGEVLVVSRNNESPRRMSRFENVNIPSIGICDGDGGGVLQQQVQSQLNMHPGTIQSMPSTTPRGLPRRREDVLHRTPPNEQLIPLLSSNNLGQANAVTSRSTSPEAQLPSIFLPHLPTGESADTGFQASS